MLRRWSFWALVATGVSFRLGLGCGGSGGSGGSANAGGIPCDVAAALAVCVGCHTDPPIDSAVGSLVTYADLTAPAPTNPSLTMAQMAVSRMQNPASPMPPAGLPPATAAHIATLSAWIAAGTPRGTCEADAGPDPTFAGGPTCAAGQFDDGGFGWWMDPGGTCNACHADGGGDGPIFTFAGTLFAEGHTEDGCVPSAAQQADISQARVEIVGADGTAITAPLVNGHGFNNGNFFTFESVPLPYTAKIVFQGRERVMPTPQTSGDCNGCHTVAGANSAPGRIALPR
jgi:hypothetical protein